MGTRFGLKVGGLAALVASALLVACGGGGGGTGGGVTPVTSTPTPTQTISAPASQATSGPLSTNGSAAFLLGSVSNAGVEAISSASFQPPAISSGTPTGSVTMTAMLPSVPAGIAAPQLHSMALRKGQTVCSSCTMQGLGYFAFSVSANETVTQSPLVTLNLPVAPPTGTAYLVVYANGTWNQTAPGLGQAAVPAAKSMTFLPTSVGSTPFALTANTVYVFAVVDVTSQTLPPTPAPTSPPSGGPTAAPAVGSDPTIPPVRSQYGYSPSDVANAFQFPVQNGFDGNGEVIGVIGDEAPSTSDLTTYVSTFSIPGNPVSHFTVTNIATPAPGSTPDTGGIQEATLDVESIMGLAPGATIKFYSTGRDLSNAAFYNAENKASVDNVDVLSISFGGCEGTPPAPPDATVFGVMVGAGEAITASAGDQGNECYVGPGNVPGVNYPASDPNVVGVGGNESDPSVGSLLNPAVWNDTVYSGQGSSGGGISDIFSLPSYQTGLTTAASQTMRNVPDVSMPGEAVAVFITQGGGWQTFAGTSWSAPQFAAMLAELNEYCGGRPSGGKTTLGEIYSAANYNGVYLDITRGNNQFAGTSPYYAAGPGYDNASGLGLASGMPIAQSRCQSRTWMSVRSGFAAEAQAARERYGEAKDTALAFAGTGRSVDLGERTASSSTRAFVVMRRTSSMASDAQTVASALRAAGFTVQVASNGAFVDARASAALVGAYFRTTIHDFAQGSYGTRYANAGALTVPAAIAPYVSTVMTDNLVARVARPIRMR